MADAGTSSISFDADIKPLFREQDRDAMRRAFDLWSYSEVVAHAESIEQRLGDGSMPCDGAWPPEHVQLFQQWIAQGTAE
jgi:hypothetical protein